MRRVDTDTEDPRSASKFCESFTSMYWQLAKMTSYVVLILSLVFGLLEYKIGAVRKCVRAFSKLENGLRRGLGSQG